MYDVDPSDEQHEYRGWIICDARTAADALDEGIPIRLTTKHEVLFGSLAA